MPSGRDQSGTARGGAQAQRKVSLVERIVRRVADALGASAESRPSYGAAAGRGTGIERGTAERPEYAPPPLSATPVVVLNGNRSPGLDAGLLAVKAEEVLNGHHRCEVTVANWGNTGDGEGPGYLHEGGSGVDFGATLEVSLARGVYLFRGRITAVEARYPAGTPPTLTLHAEGRGWELASVRRTRTFEDVSDSDAFRAIAADHGMQADLSISGPHHEVLSQVECSDLAFLQERAEALDAQLWFDEHGLRARQRGQGSFPPVTLRYGSGLREFTALADLAEQRSSVTVGGWNAIAKEATSAPADDGSIVSELGGGRSGAQVLAGTFGRRDEFVSGTSPGVGAPDEARVRFASGARRFVAGRGVAAPTPSLRPGASLTLEGLGEMFDGVYEVMTVTHRFDLTEGLRTEFSVARPWLGG